MRERGVLKRVPSDLWRKAFAASRRTGLAASEAIADAAGTLCNFIADYHEKLKKRCPLFGL
jgi:hypothetical protein